MARINTKYAPRALPPIIWRGDSITLVTLKIKVTGVGPHCKVFLAGKVKRRAVKSKTLSKIMWGCTGVKEVTNLGTRTPRSNLDNSVLLAKKAVFL